MLAGDLCSELLRFIGDYESWVAETVGIRYREQTVDGVEHCAYSASDAMALWPQLAKQVARLYSRRASAASVSYAAPRRLDI